MVCACPATTSRCSVCGRSSGEPSRRRKTARTLRTWLFGVFLAGTGVYGLTAYSVTSRTREIGLRRASGAAPRRVEAMFLRRSTVLGAVGIGLGAVGTVAHDRFLQGVLYGVQPWDPLTLGLVATLLLGILLLATLVPARRAARIDPMAAIRTE